VQDITSRLKTVLCVIFTGHQYHETAAVMLILKLYGVYALICRGPERMSRVNTKYSLWNISILQAGLQAWELPKPRLRASTLYITYFVSDPPGGFRGPLTDKCHHHTATYRLEKVDRLTCGLLAYDWLPGWPQPMHREPGWFGLPAKVRRCRYADTL
jgi:hypothetical protein